MEKIIGLKIDVDTFYGMRHGVPKILSLLEKYKIKASFFVPMGRDNTGRTVKRVFTKKGFLAKARRVGVIRTYGLRTLLYGIIFPGPKILEKNVEIIKGLFGKHEIGIHGYDHVFWHDRIIKLNYERTKKELEKAIEAYRKILGEEPKSFASPGWVTNVHALEIFKERGFIYSSDTRGYSPFYPIIENRTISLMQIPTTLPTLDEVVGIHGKDVKSLLEYFESLLTNSINVITVHAELEGKRWSNFLEAFIEKTLAQGYTFKTLLEIANELKNIHLPKSRIIYGEVEGRAGKVCIQEKPEAFSIDFKTQKL